MRTYNNLYSNIYDFKNLHQAYLRAGRCKRYNLSVLQFSSKLEEELIVLQNELIWKSYHPSPYREFYVNDPKKRLIMAPAFRDRVLHHAAHNIISPLFEKKFIYDSYACRINKGTHAGVDRLHHFLRVTQKRWSTTYCLKCDIHSFFPSVRHDKLKQMIRKTIRCKDTLWLLDLIIDSVLNGEPGIPLGNLTSQLFANIFMDDLDHFVKEQLRLIYYIRYMDDFVILLNNKRRLEEIKREIACFLCLKGLVLNSKTSIFPIKQGIDFLGYRIWPTHRLLRKSSIRRAKRKYRAFARRYKNGEISKDKIKQSLMSWLGHAGHCNSYNTRKQVTDALILMK